jgi:hypothetical protein
MDEKNSDDNQKDSYSQPKNDQAPTSGNGEIGPGTDARPANQESSETKSKKEIATPTRGVNWSQWLMIAFTGVIAASAFTYTMVAIWQLEVIGAQVDVMRSDLQETMNQVELARVQAEAAKRAADAAEKSIAANLEAFRLGQRAWVGVKGIRLKGERKEGERLEAVIIVENTGRTPALEVVVQKAVSAAYPTKEALRQPVKGGKAIFVLAPNNNFLSLKTVTESLSETDLRALESEKRGVFYLYGIITYKDIFDRRHETGFCAFYVKEAYPALEFCSTLNYMD